MVVKLNVKQLSEYHGVFRQVFLSFAVALTTMSDGLTVGWSSVKIAELTNNQNSTENVTLEQASFIGTLPIYVSPLIIPLVAYSSNHLGRKWTILLGTLTLFCSWLLLIFVEKIEYILCAVTLRGLSYFSIYSITIIYISEISQANIRGCLSTFIPVLMNLGILLSYISISYVSLKDLAIIGTVISGLVFPLFVFAPKSPYFLFMKNKPEEARKSLEKFRNTDDIQRELDDIKTIIEKSNLEKGSIKQFFTDKTCRKVSFIVLSAQAFQQFSGVDAILLFLQVLLQSFGSTLSNNVSAVLFGSGKLIACGISVILVDKIGRRSLLIFSCIVSTCTLFVMGLYFYLKDVAKYDISSISWLPLAILIIFILGYNVGLGTVPFILAGEMYPPRFKALGAAAVQIAYCVTMVIVSELFALIKDSCGFYLAFWFLSAMTFFGILFSIYYVIETKGKSLKEILLELE